jgi:dTMP kinase
MTGARRGLFISVEGADGSGKSTQARRLADYLRARGHVVVETREPGGGGEGAAAIRHLLLNGPPERWTPSAEALMMYAARAEHLDKLIRPALREGKTVITDRFADSTMAYQGIAGGLGDAAVDALHAIVVGKDDPDLTLILDVPADVGLRRAAGRRAGESRFEDKGPAFQRAVRDAFLAIARAAPARCKVVDASGDEETVWRAVAKVVDGALQSRV